MVLLFFLILGMFLPIGGLLLLINSLVTGFLYFNIESKDIGKARSIYNLSKKTLVSLIIYILICMVLIIVLAITNGEAILNA